MFFVVVIRLFLDAVRAEFVVLVLIKALGVKETELSA